VTWTEIWTYWYHHINFIFSRRDFLSFMHLGVTAHTWIDTSRRLHSYYSAIAVASGSSKVFPGNLMNSGNFENLNSPDSLSTWGVDHFFAAPHQSEAA
jgi:hypothetical protein